ncbi:MAG: hypothetical protein LIP77_03525, partial [Planctomycetes bacterium]|nr:hypothetical protein [Planctomycetota bacterium]
MSVKDNRTKFSGNSEYNAISLMIKNHLLRNVCTADVVLVTDVQAGGSAAATGWVTVKPLVCQVDSFNQRIEPVNMFRLPYSRLQGGVAAVVIDPVPGDIGIAIYTKRDSSQVAQEQKEPVRPGSYRTFDQSDGFYIGGFLNRAPTVYLEMTQENVIRLVAPESITLETTHCSIDAETFTVNASERAAINAPTGSFN